MLTFAIPTYNRPVHIAVLLDNLAAEIASVDVDVRILIRDDCSGSDVATAIEGFASNYPGSLQLIKGTERMGAMGNFSRLFVLPETEWTWILGDDDKLLPGSLKMVIELLKAKGDRLKYLHVAEDTRCTKDRPPALFTGDLLGMCNALGWLEMTGFMSGNIVRSEYLRKGFQSPHLEVYQQSSFVHSLALLEALAHEPAAFLDAPIIATQDAEQTAETKRRWKQGNVAMGYNRLVDGLECLIAKGVLPRRLETDFFRYHRGTLVSRLLYSFYVEVYGGTGAIAEIEWQRLERLAALFPPHDHLAALEAIEEGRLYLDGLAALLQEYGPAISAYNLALDSINEILTCNEFVKDRYGFNFINQ